MKREDVEALRQLLAAKTGEWRFELDDAFPNEAFVVTGDVGYIEVGGSRHGREDRAALIAAAINALPALLDIAEAVMDAPVGRLDFHCDTVDGTEACEFSPHGTRSRAKKLDGQQVRLVRVGGGA